MVPPTKVAAIPIASIIFFFSYPNFMTGFQMVFTQSQRKTAEATNPNSSLLLHQAPAAYALVSRLKTVSLFCCCQPIFRSF
jgi:hypothetical protein